MEHFATFNRLLSQPSGAKRHHDAIFASMTLFAEHYSDPTISFPSTERDNLSMLYAALNEELPVEFEALLCRCIKVFLRKLSNRVSMGKHGMSALVRALSRQLLNPSVATVEVGNAILNACYDGANIDLFLEVDGLRPLLALLQVRDAAVLSSILGALQGVCYVPTGRQAVRQHTQVFVSLSQFLQFSHDVVRTRAVGCLHNLSTDNVSLLWLREAGCLPALVSCLRDGSGDICHAAAGALQNMSRENASREYLAQSDAVPLLTDLLLSSDVRCQTAAVGALMNILGPSLNEDGMTRLRKALSDGVVLGIVKSCVFDPGVT